MLPWALGGRELGGEILEVGSGSGAMAAEVLRAHPEANVTATDVDARMVAEARRALAPFGDRASVLQADAAALPFPDGRFDAVISFLMLHHVGPWEDALAELVRVLRPGGRLLAYDLLDNRFERALHRVTNSPGVRLMRLAELSAVLRDLPLEDVTINDARIVVRFGGAKVSKR